MMARMIPAAPVPNVSNSVTAGSAHTLTVLGIRDALDVQSDENILASDFPVTD